MKYIITGSLGHISQPLVSDLVKAGHEVDVITSNASRVAAIQALGAKALVGSLEDTAFINDSFKGADAVYLMIPPNFGVTDWRAFQDKISDNYVSAIKANNIKYVVTLSSIGAHMGLGAGPVDGLAYLEQQLKTLPNVAVKNLRPSYFFYNLFSLIPLIKNMNIMGSNFGTTEEKLVLTTTEDIAAAATKELLTLNFTGQTVRYISSDERHPNEIAAVLSAAIGKPGIPWVPFSDEQSLGGMLQAGLPETIAVGYTTMGKAIRDGEMQKDYWENKPTPTGTLTLEAFAKQFAVVYNQ